ncbi:hypothetical protein HDV04_003895 [Boothiomyces sp. JEL0838]|nr:hypothetical protein HDV04_003895 [Boothiomyces sp. JEL0838]
MEVQQFEINDQHQQVGERNTVVVLDNTEHIASGEERLHHHQHYSHRANWLRAGVLGASDGLVSNSSIILGILAANKPEVAVLTGLSALVAGTISMALGEYISVSSQRDTEEADIKLERKEHERGGQTAIEEFEELKLGYIEKGLSPETAHLVATELHDLHIDKIVQIHVREELGIDVDDLTNPWEAAGASAIAFATGAAPPLIVVAITTSQIASVLIAIVCGVFLLVFGGIGSHLGGGSIWKGSLRVFIGGMIAMGATFGIGAIFEHTG